MKWIQKLAIIWCQMTDFDVMSDGNTDNHFMAHALYWLGLPVLQPLFFFCFFKKGGGGGIPPKENNENNVFMIYKSEPIRHTKSSVRGTLIPVM